MCLGDGVWVCVRDKLYPEVMYVEASFCESVGIACSMKGGENRESKGRRRKDSHIGSLYFTCSC